MSDATPANNHPHYLTIRVCSVARKPARLLHCSSIRMREGAVSLSDAREAGGVDIVVESSVGPADGLETSLMHWIIRRALLNECKQ